MVNVSPYVMDGMPPNALEVQELVTRRQKPEPPAPEAPKESRELEEPEAPEKPVAAPAKDELEAQEKSAPLQDDTVHVWQSEPKVSETPSEAETQEVQEPAASEAPQTSSSQDAANSSEARDPDPSSRPDNDMENIDLA